MDQAEASAPRLIGMVHLGPLPGSPGFSGTIEPVLEAAVCDALTLADAGFDALMIENYGDVPFFADNVPAITVAAMARAVATVRAAVSLPLGVNVLRNDGLAALSIAATCGAQFIRVNVLAGSMYTDQGLISGRAAEIARARAAWAPEIEILADVFVKHAAPPPGLTIEEAAADTYHRGLADALVVSGPATGRAPDRKGIERIRKAVPEAPILVGSGATRRTVASLLELVDGVIAGTDVKQGGVTEAPVDPKRAAAIVRAAQKAQPPAAGAEQASPEASARADGASSDDPKAKRSQKGKPGASSGSGPGTTKSAKPKRGKSAAARSDDEDKQAAKRSGSGRRSASRS